MSNPREHAALLIRAKDAIEAEISAQLASLKANDCDMSSPLVDSEGFPRADLDIYAVRSARTRIIELRNDLKETMDEIGKVLQKIYDPSLDAPVSTPAGAPSSTPAALSPFAKVDGVAPESPAAQAGLLREDLIIKFGHLTAASFSTASLEPLADIVSRNENRGLQVQVLRDGLKLSLQFTPRKGWGGRGLLGCHIVPYTAS